MAASVSTIMPDARFWFPLQPIPQYKAAKQWDICAKYAAKALELAQEMPLWNNSSKNGPRTAAISSLEKFLEFSQAKLAA